jgi:hypothetical protein
MSIEVAAGPGFLRRREVTLLFRLTVRQAIGCRLRLVAFAPRTLADHSKIDQITHAALDGIMVRP